jgi:phosphate transport system substrate-binding protein
MTSVNRITLNPGNKSMNRIFLSLLFGAVITTGVHAAVILNGSGATFPAPLYIRWAADFRKSNPEITVNYQGVGSGAGVKQFTDGITDFGASDVAMSDAEIAKVSDNVLMLPATAGTIVLAYNLPGVDSGLKLSRQAIAGILLGTVKTWDDVLISKENPGVKLPSTPVTVVTRADGSGTTAVFTAHLSAVSPEFATKIGSGKQVTWQVGVSGKGNDGVTALIKQTPGAIGYVEYGYAVNNKLTSAALQNKSGNFVIPTIESGTATLASVVLPSNFRAFITDPEGANDYPIATFSWLLVKRTYADPAKAAAVKAFVKYGLTKGQEAAPSLGYITLPQAVAEKVLSALDSVK